MATGQIKRQLQAWHRWLGVVLCVPIVLWFLSGAVMLFVPYPALLEDERLHGLAPLAADAALLPPDRALRLAGLEHAPASARLGMLDGRAVWRLRGQGGEAVVVDAGSGQRIAPLDAATALREAQAFQRRSGGDAAAARHQGLIERDQWTINGLRGLQPPLHRVGFGDGRVLYLSRDGGEVVRDASRVERTWGWTGAVLHWIYVTPLRGNGPLWTQVVLWLSGVSLVVAVSGLLIGTWRSVEAWQRRRRISAYRGVHYWHHILGWGGGLLVLTWLFSGWLSMGPFEPAPNPAVQGWRQAWSGEPAAAGAPLLPPVLAAAGDVVELELRWLAGEPWYRTRSREGHVAWQPALAVQAGAPELDQLLARVEHASGLRIAARRLLRHYDRYYVSHPHRAQRALPVWRIELDDPQRTWVHVSDERLDVVSLLDQERRTERWLYNGLHSWDLPWLLERPVLRYTLLLAGLAVGLALSLTGFVVGWKRLQIGWIARGRQI